MLSGILLDLGGVVYVGDQVLPGAVQAIERLRAAGAGIRFLTNTTRKPRADMLCKLRNLGVPAEPNELFMPATAARDHLAAARLQPHLLVHPALEADFEGLGGDAGTAVVVGDAGRSFDYRRLNAAFRALLEADAFLALAKNRVFQDADGRLSLDAGPFVAALEFASGRSATVLGKPSAAFFQAAVDSLGCAPEEAVMVGDDVEADVGGAMAIGLSGLLLRQGKYQAGDEDAIDPAPTAVLDDLPAAVDWILSKR